MCGCVKADSGCGKGCRCQPALCKNRRVASGSNSESDEKENTTPTSVLDTTPPSYFGSKNHPNVTFVKKRQRSYFFNNDDKTD